MMDSAFSLKNLKTAHVYQKLKSILFLIFPVLVVLGNFELWLGASSLTLPWLLLIILPFVLLDMAMLWKSRCNSEWLPFMFLYGLLFVLGGLSALADSDTSLLRNLASLLPLMVALAVLYCFRDVSLSFNVTKIMCVAGACLVFMIFMKSILLYWPAIRLGQVHEVFGYKSEMGLPLGKSNFLAVFLAFFAVFAWRANKVLYVAVLLAACLTLSRFGVAFVLFAGLCAYLLNYVRLSVIALVIVGFSILTVLPVFFFPTQAVALARECSLPESLIARFELWRAALELLAGRFFWGAGPGGFTTYLELVGWPRYEWGTHNFVLAQWIEYGFLGLTVYFIILVRFFLLHAEQDSADYELVKLAGAILLFYALFENVVGLVAFEVMFAYLICLLSARRTA
ncbi:MAG: O-antigen ligase domain-containing protein [Pseudomonas sp.]|uniref:O-antigen ligase family protein n=1 Tax=Ectopseudomonas guguanensis TaxID=1198456 RepID=UPI0012D5EC35|nr:MULTISPECIES: O-antigen ligase family protein [Pseudomonas]MPT21133.1 O-antigen ligase domain-containing protein [Pseudomonas sp.]WJH56530.1 O-antigen ligase family protein [Pseudomonas guguanensis]